jgi:hypothetical protein
MLAQALVLWCVPMLALVVGLAGCRLILEGDS